MRAVDHRRLMREVGLMPSALGQAARDQVGSNVDDRVPNDARPGLR